MMELLENYNAEDQENIMATLNVVQARGWSPHNDDQYQFHIILGGHMRVKEARIKELEKELEKTIDKNKQNVKDFYDLKENLQQEREINEELLDEVKRNDEEIKHLKKCVQNRDEIDNSLEEEFRERTEEIKHLKENCESLAVQVGKELILEQKLKIQNNVILELKGKIKDVEKLTNVATIEEIESLMSEIKQLEKENKRKEYQLKEVHEENSMMHDKLKFLEENKIELIDNLEKLKSQNAHSVSLSEELNPAKVFTCERCDQTFGRCRDLKSHIRNEHKKREVTTTMKLRLQKLEKQILQQKLYITNKIADLKETESLEQQTCRCRGWCAITHQKHSWKPIRSKRILKMIQSSGINFQP